MFGEMNVSALDTDVRMHVPSKATNHDTEQASDAIEAQSCS